MCLFVGGVPLQFWQKLPPPPPEHLAIAGEVAA